jgi:tetratricopeptide (TPR) repeat protein
MKKIMQSTLTTNLRLVLAIMLLSCFGACKKYLDARPDKSQVVPASQQDLQALLDNADVMNRSFPSYGEAAGDNYYLPLTSYNALVLAQDKSLYTWQPDGMVSDSQWLSPYKVVYYANQVLESLGKISGGTEAQAAALKGAALYFRAYAFFQVAGLFAQPYDPASAAGAPGIPIRLTADFNQRSVRASNLATFAQITSDLRQALRLLPAGSAYPSRPTKLAAYAAIARTFLVMRDYDQAGAYADSALALNPPLMDFNTLSPAAPNPISRFNAETIFYAMSGGSALLVPSRCKVDSSLYASYAGNDLRKSIFFKSNNDGTYAFKGNYDGVQSSIIFTGLATDELYLISAECAARAGRTANAMATLNTLLQTRFVAGTFQPFAAADAATALAIILKERRKELVFRGLRWTDLRRLNQEAAYRTTLQRNLGTAGYQLAPLDPRYALLIPQEVITASGMPQNGR